MYQARHNFSKIEGASAKTWGGGQNDLAFNVFAGKFQGKYVKNLIKTGEGGQLPPPAATPF